MNYDIFVKLQDGSLVLQESESEQAFMVRVMQDVFSQSGGVNTDRIYEKLTSTFLRCDSASQTLSVLFRAEDWMLNPQDTLHGGIICTAMDKTMSVLARYVKKTRGVATVQLSMNFIRPINKGERFIVTAMTEHAGRRSTVLRAELRSAATGKLAATASGVFM